MSRLSEVIGLDLALDTAEHAAEAHVTEASVVAADPDVGRRS